MSSNSFDYNNNWPLWDDMKKYGSMSTHTRRLVFSALKNLEFDSVLDIGCGNGLLLSEIEKKFKAKLFGCDISSEAVDFAKGNLANGEFYVLDISQGYLDKEFDLILSCDVLEHIPNYKKALQNIRRMTRNHFLFTTLQGCMRKFEVNVGHVNSFNKSELKYDLKSVGFQIVTILEWGFPFYSPLYRSLFNLKKVETFSYGKYGLMKKIISRFIYYLFFLNSYRKGDYLVVLCK